MLILPDRIAGRPLGIPKTPPFSLTPKLYRLITPSRTQTAPVNEPSGDNGPLIPIALGIYGGGSCKATYLLTEKRPKLREEIWHFLRHIVGDVDVSHEVQSSPFALGVDDLPLTASFFKLLGGHSSRTVSILQIHMGMPRLYKEVSMAVLKFFVVNSRNRFRPSSDSGSNGGPIRMFLPKPSIGRGFQIAEESAGRTHPPVRFSLRENWAARRSRTGGWVGGGGGHGSRLKHRPGRWRSLSNRCREKICVERRLQKVLVTQKKNEMNAI